MGTRKSGEPKKRSSGGKASEGKRGTRKDGKQPKSTTRKGEKLCFVMMPFTEPEGYPPEHFKRVYRYLIQPACEQAGFKPLRVDDINTSNHIVIDILRYIVEADMAICDLSARSPNVLYELGIRHAFNRPVTLIKDLRTARMFDIQGLRDIEYDETLRVDGIESVVPVIAESLTNTYGSNSGSPGNSVIQLLGIAPATMPEVMSISPETSLLLGALEEMRERLRRMESLIRSSPSGTRSSHGEASSEEHDHEDSPLVFSGEAGDGNSNSSADPL